MVKNGYIGDDQSGAALNEMSVRLKSAEFQRQCDAQTNIKAPHFVNYVRLDLERRFGPEVVCKGGVQVYTTFDPKAQAIAEEVARKQIALLKDQHVTNAAIVVLKPKYAGVRRLAARCSSNTDGHERVMLTRESTSR